MPVPQRLAGQPVAGRRHRMRRATALTATLLCLAHGAPAAAQSGADRTRTGTGPLDRPAQLAQAGEATRLSIAAQDLNGALLAFAEATGLQLFYEVDKLRGLEADGLQGRYTPDRALEQLLAGTGLTYSFSGDGEVRIAQADGDADGGDGPAQLGPITVEAESEDPYGPADGYKADRSATATRLDLALENTPVPVQVVPRDVLDDTEATRVEDALELSAGVQKTNSFGNQSDGFLLRGFDATFAEDGVASGGAGASVTGQRDSATVERVEVLRGPAAALYGEGSPGGIVNVISKRPQPDRFFEFDSSVSTFERYRQTFDGNLSFGSDAQLQTRLSGAGEYFDSYRDHVEGYRTVLAPAVTFAPTDALEVRFRSEYLRNEQPFDRGIPIDDDGDPLAGSEDYFGDPDDGDNVNENGRTQLEAAYEFADGWTARVSGGWTYNSLEGRSTEPRAIAPFSLPPAVLGQPVVEGDTIFRVTRDRDQETNILTGRTELSGSFTTGPIEHETLVSFEARRINDDRDFTQTSLFGQPDLVSISDPVIDTPDQTPTQISNFEDEVDNYALLASDRLTLWEDLDILAGGRFDIVEQTQTAETNTGVTVTDVDERAFSPTLGAVYSPVSWGSVFARYAESFEVNTLSDASGRPLEPREGESIEGGIRVNVPKTDLRATLTLFDIDLENVPEGDPLTPTAVATSQESRGVELTLQGEVTDGLSLIGSYTYTDAEITDLPGGPDGVTPQGVPEHAASLFASYAFQDSRLKGLKLRGGVTYVGERPNSVQTTTNTPFGAVMIGGKELDPYVRFDVGAAYAISDWLDASVRIENLFDTDYQRPGVPGFALPEPPRTFSASLSLKF
jgi:iron complex outermembrane receptor protein